MGFDECDKLKIEHDVMRISAGITDRVGRALSTDKRLCLPSTLEGLPVQGVPFDLAAYPGVRLISE